MGDGRRFPERGRLCALPTLLTVPEGGMMATKPKGRGHGECRATTTGETETPTPSNWPCGLNELEAMSPGELLIEFVRTHDRLSKMPSKRWEFSSV